MTFNRRWQTQAAETPIGVPQNPAGMDIAAVYLQPVDMEPEGPVSDGPHHGDSVKLRAPGKKGGY